jgi:hypothetical protein
MRLEICSGEKGKNIAQFQTHDIRHSRLFLKANWDQLAFGDLMAGSLLAQRRPLLELEKGIPSSTYFFAIYQKTVLTIGEDGASWSLVH